MNFVARIAIMRLRDIPYIDLTENDREYNL